jgi:GxxExxY protein
MDQLLHAELTDKILRCAVAVHKELGPGLPEHSYQMSMGLEMSANGIAFVDDQPLAVRYRGVVVGWHRPDFVIEQRVIVELKSAARMDPVFAKQVLTYLKVTGLRVGLLVNFNVASFANDGIRRFVL